MFNTIRSKILMLIVTLMIITTISILITTKINFNITLHHLHNKLDRDILQFALRSVETEYKDLVLTAYRYAAAKSHGAGDCRHSYDA